MISIGVLATNLVVFLLLMVPGILVRRTGLAPEGLGKGLANIVLYAAQPALIILAYNCDFDSEILVRAGFVLLFSVIAHVLSTVVAMAFYKKAPDKVRRVLQFATVFTNAGYMGIPLLEALYRDTVGNIGIYASIYVMVFNIFCWSVGCYIYSGDKSYMRPRKIFLNPAMISTVIGLLLFFTPANRWLSGDSFSATVVYSVLTSLKSTVAPLSMFIIGLGLAEIRLSDLLREKRMYFCFLVRMILLPTGMFLLMRLVSLWFYDDMIVRTVVLLSAAAPIATSTGMFAEIFDGDRVYAGKVVAASTILSLATMPLVALLLYI